jgi:hypothetical protein
VLLATATEAARLLIEAIGGLARAEREAVIQVCGRTIDTLTGTLHHLGRRRS